MALGVFPRGLAEARPREARRLLADRINSGTLKKQEEHQRRVAQLQTFEAVAREWLTKQSRDESHGARNAQRLEQHVFPWVGSLGISSIKRAQNKRVFCKDREDRHHTTGNLIAIATSKILFVPSIFTFCAYRGFDVILALSMQAM